MERICTAAKESVNYGLRKWNETETNRNMMMSGKILCCFLIAVSAASVMTGCATYKKPFAGVEQSHYTTVTEKEKTALPKDLTLLTLEEAQNIALSNNPGFKMKYFAIATARARYYQSFSSYYPTLNATMEVSQRFSRTLADHNFDKIRSQQDTYAPGLSGSWLLFNSLVREMNVLAARHTWKGSIAQEDDARRLLIRAVAYAYNDVMLAAAQQRIAIADMNYSADLLKDTQIKFEAGAVPLSDVLNFKIRYNNGESSLVEAQYSYAANKYVLAGLLGLTDGTIDEKVKFPEMPSAEGEVLPDVSVFLDTALANRPDLRAYRENLEAAKFSYWSSLCAFGPTVSANYSISYTHNRYLTKGIDNTNRDYRQSYYTGTGGLNYGITASWNLFEGGNTYFNARAAQATMAQAEYQLAEAWIEVITDVRTAYDYYITNLKQVKLYQKTYELTKQTRDLVEEEYKAGNAELTRLNEAQRDLVTAENNLVSSVVKMNNAKAQLEAAVNVR